MILYALTILVSAFLLFQVQPVIAKIILPWFGGSAAVWTTCLLFFQMVLLLGYLYSHAVIRYLKPRMQMLVHASLLLLADKTLAGAVVGVVGTLLFGSLSSIVVTTAYGDITGRWLASRAAAEARVASAPEWWAGVTPPASSEIAEVEPTAESGPVSESAPVEPAAAAAETPAPVAWGDAGADAAPAAEPVTAPPPAAVPIAGVSRNERRVYVLGVFLVGCLLLIPTFAIAAPSLGKIGLSGVPAQDRGKILAGTERDPANPCAPKAQATTFESTDTIYVGGYFSRAVLPGQSATVHVLIDGAEAATAPLNARGQLVACYYEQDALTGLSPAEYRILVDDDTGVLAEGTFTVK